MITYLKAYNVCSYSYNLFNIIYIYVLFCSSAKYQIFKIIIYMYILFCNAKNNNRTFKIINVSVIQNQ